MLKRLSVSLAFFGLFVLICSCEKRSEVSIDLVGTWDCVSTIYDYGDGDIERIGDIGDYIVITEKTITFFYAEAKGAFDNAVPHQYTVEGSTLFLSGIGVYTISMSKDGSMVWEFSPTTNSLLPNTKLTLIKREEIDYANLINKWWVPVKTEFIFDGSVVYSINKTELYGSIDKIMFENGNTRINYKNELSNDNKRGEDYFPEFISTPQSFPYTLEGNVLTIYHPLMHAVGSHTYSIKSLSSSNLVLKYYAPGDTINDEDYYVGTFRGRDIYSMVMAGLCYDDDNGKTHPCVDAEYGEDVFFYETQISYYKAL